MTNAREQAKRPKTPARQGNALVVAMMVMGLAATVIVTATNSAVSTRHQSTVASKESEVLAALDIVLARRQRQVLDLAATGRAEDFSAINPNYGTDFVGGVEVRWKLEPVWAKRRVALYADQTIENPQPDGGLGAPTSAVENPSAFFMYRVAGEAMASTLVEHDAGSSNPSDDTVELGGRGNEVIARAQGVRYISTLNESVLKYLLYWGLEGPKGDLELSHGPTTQLVGPIYAGGSIFMGSGTVSNDWLALRPSNGDTIIGPPLTAPTWASGTNYTAGTIIQTGGQWYQAKQAHTASASNEPASSGNPWRTIWENVSAYRVEAQDGLYRLSKQTMYGAFNSFPMASTVPSGFTVNGSYSLSTATFPGERAGGYPFPDPAYPGDVYLATDEGRNLNPARVADALATRALAGTDDKRRFNVAITGGGLQEIPLRGVDESPTAVGNDSRDAMRETTSGFVWSTHSLDAVAPGFNKQVRTKQTGLQVAPLGDMFKGRPNESQALETSDGLLLDLDGDLTNDEHEYARPMFVSATGSNTADFATRRQNLVNDVDAIEVPGRHLKDTFNADWYMGRRVDYRGWHIVDKDGVPITTEPTGGMGLVIRERPRPETNYFTPMSLPSPSDPLYMPFAYGHVRSSVWPFTAADVAGDATTQAGTDRQSSYLANVNSAVALQRYEKGSVSFRSAANPGPNWTSGTTDTGGAYQRFPYIQSDTWRFIGLGKPKLIEPEVNGLTGVYYNDRPVGSANYLAPFGGYPVATRTDSLIDFSWASAPTGITGLPNSQYSVRWYGYVRPTITDNYQFIANRAGGNCGMRVWVDGVLMCSDWNMSNWDIYSTQRQLVAGQNYPIIVEMYNGSASTSAVQLDWQGASLARQAIPTTNLFAAEAPIGSSWSEFTSVQGRIDRVSVSGGKAGLMLRPGAGVSLVNDGRDPYVSISYSPSRGIVAQVRGERSRVASGKQTGWFIGNGTVSGSPVDADGEIITSPVDASVVRMADLTTSALGTATYNESAGPIAPEKGEQRQLTVYTPGTTTPPAVPPGLGTWPTGSGTNAISGGNWTNLTLSPLKRTANNPFSVPEGVVERVWIGPVTLRTQKWPQERTWRNINANYNLRMAGRDSTNDATQRFRWYRGALPGATGDAWPATWGTYDPSDDDLDNSSKRLFLFSQQSGNRCVVEGAFNEAGTGDVFTLTSDSNQVVQTGASTRGTVINRSPNNTSADAGWVYWFQDGNADLKPDGTYDVTTVSGTAKTIYYISSGGVDTRPRVFNGSTFVRYLSSAETQSLMDNTYGAGHVVVTTLPTYPAVANQAYATGDPPVGTPSMASFGYGFTRLSAATTAVATTITVNSFNNSARPFAVGELLSIHSAAGTEIVKITAVNDLTQVVTVDRAQFGTTGIAHPTQSLVSHMALPMSALGQAIGASAAGTAQVWQVRTLDFAGGSIRVGDVLEVDGEHVRVTATTGAVGIAQPTIGVVRGVNGTPATAHVINSQLNSPSPVAGTLTAAITNAVTTLTMPSTAMLSLGMTIRVNTEFMAVTSVISPTQISVGRAHRGTTAVAHAANSAVFVLVAKTFAVTRGRTVTFDVNPWITAGAAPTPTWRSGQPSDFGWYWSGVNQYSAWQSFWSTVTPIPRTGGIASRAWLDGWNVPPSAQPTVTTPTNINSAFPPESLAAASGRWDDDQPASWVNGTTYPAGALVWNANAIYRATTGHTAGSSTAPGTGGSWQSAWEQTGVWLRIERVPSTTRVRLLYAISSATPSGADWKPVMTVQNSASASPAPGRVSNLDGDSRVLEIDLASWFKPGRATLALAPGTGNSITLTVTSGSFSIGDIVRVGEEYMYLSGGGGSVFTVIRNWGGTSASIPNITTVGGEVIQARYRGPDLLVGLCGQSGAFGTTMDVDASNLQIQTTSADTDLQTIDATDWEEAPASGQPNDTTRYLASQYQVFWGPYDITEDFFWYGQDSTRIADEDWIYNTREFWSQSRWWENGDEKDPVYLYPSNASILSMRELLSKTTILSINMGALQYYIKNRLLSEAIADRISGFGPTNSLFGPDEVLRSRVSKSGLLVHASRYNRYPWNPNLNGANPWNPSLPNSTTAGLTNTQLAALDPVSRRTQFTAINGVMNTVNTMNSLAPGSFTDLVPYPLGSSTVAGQFYRAPAIKPQDYHHAIRLTNASDIDWGYTGVNDAYKPNGMSFYTPNQLYIQGDINTVPHNVLWSNLPASKPNKLGIYCDTAILLSNSWSDTPMRQPGLVMNTSTGAIISGGSLAMNQVSGNILTTASDTSYQFALLTHTQPTNRETVRMGEASSFINTMLFLEDWSGRNMNFVGSIVAMDTRRYTRSFLLDAPKWHGRTPFGWLTGGGNPLTQTAWANVYTDLVPGRSSVDIANRWPNSGAGTIQSIQGVYGAPSRNLFYNPDFFYEEGQPPKLPFGTKATGLGGWTRVVR